MDLSSILSSNYVTIGGAVLIVVVAVFIFKSGPKTAKKVEAKEGKESKPKQQSASVEAGNETDLKTGSGLSKWKVKLDFLKAIRFSKTSGAKQPEEVLVPDILQDSDSEPEPEPPPAPAPTPEPEEEPAFAEQPAEETVEDTEMGETVFEEESTATAEVTEESVAEQDSEPIEDQTVEEEEPEPEPEPEPVQENTYVDGAQDKDNDIFSMFTDEEVEETDTSKVAAALDMVDIKDIMNEIAHMKKYMRK